MASVAGVSIVAVGIMLFLLSSICCICSLVRGHRQSRADAAINAATASAALTLRRQPTASGQSSDSEQQQRLAAPEGQPGRASPTLGLPSFAYNRSVMGRHNVTSSGSEEAAATCSVCLGPFQVGETVRLLPVCLHLYHVECIDPWLDANSTCPLCRSGTDSTTIDGGLLPPV